MNLLSWLDGVAGPWTWRHYLLVSAVALVVAAVFVFTAMRQGQAEAGTGRLYRGYPMLFARASVSTGPSGSELRRRRQARDSHGKSGLD
jgi:hypothetical protein